jgi:hypothetical protein
MNFFRKFTSKQILISISLACFFILVILCSLRVFYYAQLLRPAADDYCFGSLAQYGVIGGVRQWWDTWTGNLFSTFIQNSLVGIPLAFFPWRLASSLSFIAVNVVFALSIWVICHKKINTLFLALLSLSSPFLWWSYLWSPMAFGSASGLEFANAVLHWQTINSGSVFCTLLIVVFIISAQRIEIASYPKLLLITLFGVFTGLCGEPLNLVAIIVLASIYMYRLFIDHKRNSLLLIFIFSICIGLFLSHQAPGYLIRYNALKPNLSLDLNRILEVLIFTIPPGINKFLNFYFNIGSLILISITSAISWLFFKKNNSQVQFSALNELFICIWFGLVLSLVARFFEAFSYEGYWHFIPSLVCIFLSLILMGIYVGSFFSRLNLGIFSFIFLGMACISVLIGTISTIYLVESIKVRHTKWHQGPADTIGISDVNDANGWQMACWKKIIEFRQDTPKRGQ